VESWLTLSFLSCAKSIPGKAKTAKKTINLPVLMRKKLSGAPGILQ
jgi:hypothetical protein